MSDIGSGRAFLQTSSSKPCMEQNVSDSEVNVGNKRRKDSLSTPVVMESENPEAHLEPVVMKRKRTSGNIFERKLKEETVPGNLSSKETEQVPSDSKEECLNQILPEQKQAAKDKGARSEVDGLRNDFEKKCHKRRVNLFQKQKVQFEEFHRIWEKKRSDLERDYRLEQSMIHSIYGKGTPRTNNKLKLLAGTFVKKMKEHNLLKDVECKKLKAEQFVARDEERQKEARWLAACSLPSEQLVARDEERQKETQCLAACRSGEPTTDHGPESLCLHSEKVGHDVNNTLSTDPQNDPDVAFLQSDQLKIFCPRKIICALPASRESVPGESEAVKLNKEVLTKVPGTVSIETNEPSEQTKASCSPHHCASLLPQASEDQIPRGSSSDIIQDIGAQVNSVPDQSALVVENQNASSFEVAASVNVDTVTVVQPNVELHDRDAADTSRGEVANLQSNDKLQDQDATDLEDQTALLIEVANSEPLDVVNPVQSSIGAPAVLNGEELLSVDVFPSCNESPLIEVEIERHNPERISSRTAEVTDTVVVSHESPSQLGENRDLQNNHIGIGSGSQVNLERNSSQTAQTTDTLLLPHESTSQLGGNLVLQSNHFGMGSESQVIHETSVEVSTSSWNSGTVPQILANTLELPHQAGLQLGSVGNLYGSVNPFSRHQVTSFSSPPLYAAPLQLELAKISKDIEQLLKSHRDMKLQLKSDCEKEVQEMLAHINSKYDLTLQEAEAEFSREKNRLDKNRSKVLMNKFLAETFSSNCRDLSLLQGNQQASPSSSMQHQTLQHLVRPPPVPMSHQTVYGHPIRTPNIQQLLQSNPTRHTSITPSPQQTPQHAPAFSFSSMSQPLRPLVINTFTPTANPGYGGNVRSVAPHLQPRAASFMPTPTFPSIVQHRPSQSLQLPPSPPPSHPMQSSSTFQNRPQVQGEPPALLNPSLSAPGFSMDIPTSSCLHQINSSFGSLEPSHLARLRNVQGNLTSSAAVNTICISDDD